MYRVLKTDGNQSAPETQDEIKQIVDFSVPNSVCHIAAKRDGANFHWIDEIYENPTIVDLISIMYEAKNNNNEKVFLFFM